MMAGALMVLSAAIVFALGCIHLVYTFWGPKLNPRDPALQARMREVHLVITRETTMWRAWIGFNASHSLGAILFGLVYGYLALVHPAFLFQSGFLLGVGLCLLGAYVFLAKAYFFSVPFAGILASVIAYVASLVVRFVG